MNVSSIGNSKKLLKARKILSQFQNIQKVLEMTAKTKLLRMMA